MSTSAYTIIADVIFCILISFNFAIAESKLLLTLAVVASTQLAVKVISILFGLLSVYVTGTLAWRS